MAWVRSNHSTGRTDHTSPRSFISSSVKVARQRQTVTTAVDDSSNQPTTNERTTNNDGERAASSEQQPGIWQMMMANTRPLTHRHSQLTHSLSLTHSGHLPTHSLTHSATVLRRSSSHPSFTHSLTQSPTDERWRLRKRSFGVIIKVPLLILGGGLPDSACSKLGIVMIALTSSVRH